MLKQVFINLMVNACEAMPQGGELLVKTHLRLEQNKSMISISVIDSGKGIPVDIEDSLFDPFVKGNDQGTGLGLSISQRIAELHHGWISAANNPDKGATFTVHLPKPDEQ
jgi:signal transduction histidine kinase